MADAKTTPEQWQRARIQWETEPLASYAQIAESLAVSKPLVGQHAKREGWQKRLTSEAVSAKAREKVDSKFTENPARSEIQAAGVDAAPQQKRHTVELPDIPLGLSETDARAAAEAESSPSEKRCSKGTARNLMQYVALPMDPSNAQGRMTRLRRASTPRSWPRP